MSRYLPRRRCFGLEAESIIRPTHLDGSDVTSIATSQVPMELWERIIDLVGTKSNTDPITYYPTINTCCLVCSFWLPRSRYNLFSTVSITEEPLRSGFSRVLCLARTVCERTDLACLINELQIRPSTSGRAVPLAVAVGPGSWATSMLSLRSLKLVGVGWYPVLYNATISQFPTLVRLELERVAFDRATSLFYLIWSLPHLVCVVLNHVSIPKLSQMNLKRLCSTRPKAVLGRLTELYISGNLGDEEHFPPAEAFGKALRKVHLEFSSRHWHKTRLREHLLMATALEEFHASIHLGGDGETAPDRLCSELIYLLSRSPVIRLVNLHLHPTSSMRGGYGMRRSSMIEAFVASPSHMGVLELSLHDEGWTHDSAWWSTRLSSRQSRGWGEIKVDVQVQRSYVGQLWLPEPKDDDLSETDYHMFTVDDSTGVIEDLNSTIRSIRQAFRKVREDLQRFDNEGYRGENGVVLQLSPEWDKLQGHFHEILDTSRDIATEAAAFMRQYTEAMLENVHEYDYAILKDELANFIISLAEKEQSVRKATKDFNQLADDVYLFACMIDLVPEDADAHIKEAIHATQHRIADLHVRLERISSDTNMAAASHPSLPITVVSPAIKSAVALGHSTSGSPLVKLGHEKKDAKQELETCTKKMMQLRDREDTLCRFSALLNLDTLSTIKELSSKITTLVEIWEWLKRELHSFEEQLGCMVDPKSRITKFFPLKISRTRTLYRQLITLLEQVREGFRLKGR